MARPKKTTVKQTDDSTKISQPLHDFKVELPADIELFVEEAHKLSGYVFKSKGRFWRDGRELMCVRLIDKHM